MKYQQKTVWGLFAGEGTSMMGNWHFAAKSASFVMTNPMKTNRKILNLYSDVGETTSRRKKYV